MMGEEKGNDMSCGSWCVYYKSKGVTSACTNCSDYINMRKPKFELGKVDIFKLADGLSKRKAEGDENPSEPKPESKLKRCPNPFSIKPSSGKSPFPYFLTFFNFSYSWHNILLFI